jgi:hypothetical protein
MYSKIAQPVYSKHGTEAVFSRCCPGYQYATEGYPKQCETIHIDTILFGKPVDYRRDDLQNSLALNQPYLARILTFHQSGMNPSFCLITTVG